jgi:hypothetical protein
MNGIRMDIGEIGWEGVEWIQLAQDRGQWWALVNMVINLRVLAHGVNSPFLLVPMAAWLLGY